MTYRFKLVLDRPEHGLHALEELVLVERAAEEPRFALVASDGRRFSFADLSDAIVGVDEESQRLLDVVTWMVCTF